MSSWTAPRTEEELKQIRKDKANARRMQRKNRCKQGKLSLWHKFVLVVGYAALLYGVATGVVYLMVWLEAAL